MDEEQIADAVESDSQALAHAIRGRAMAEVLYPSGKKLKELRNLVARMQGPNPDGYDLIAYGVHDQMTSILHKKAVDVLDGKENGRHDFVWGGITDSPLLQQLKELTVSLGGGKGRKEGVELGKAAPPVQPKSRWSWRRKE